MTWGGRVPVERLPTLTEVVELAHTQRPPVRDEPAATPVPATSPVDMLVNLPVELPIELPVNPNVETFSAVLIPAAITEEQLINRVLTDLQLQIDLMLESRLREVLAPLLERATEGLVRDARSELASALHDAVALAVTKALERHRTQ